LREELARGAPGGVPAGQAVAEAHRALGEIESAAGRHEQALGSFEKVRALHEGFLDAERRPSPRVLNLQASLAEDWRNLGTEQAKLSRPAEAVRCFQRARALREELLRADPKRPGGAEQLYRAACESALCVPLEGPAERERHAREAVEALRAAARGYRDAGRLRREPCFECLRGREDFRRVVEEVGR
jgi:tetratricopeptide (TPR) repeat protein